MNGINHDPQRFGALGYCLFPGVFDAAETEANRQLLEEAASAGEIQEDRYLGEPHAKHDAWRAVCCHPPLLDAIESVLGPDLILVYSSVFIKQAHSPAVVLWHQDNTYWPSVHGTDVLTVWLAIDDATAANSAMKVIPGSHAGYREMEQAQADNEDAMLSRHVEVTAEMEASAVTLEMSAGSMSIHDSYLLHGSDANRTDLRRAGYTIRYCDPKTAWVDMDEHPIPVYLMRGEAGDRGERYTDARPRHE